MVGRGMGGGGEYHLPQTSLQHPAHTNKASKSSRWDELVWMHADPAGLGLASSPLPPMPTLQGGPPELLSGGSLARLWVRLPGLGPCCLIATNLVGVGWREGSTAVCRGAPSQTPVILRPLLTCVREGEDSWQPPMCDFPYPHAPPPRTLHREVSGGGPGPSCMAWSSMRQMLVCIPKPCGMAGGWGVGGGRLAAHQGPHLLSHRLHLYPG